MNSWWWAVLGWQPTLTVDVSLAFAPLGRPFTGPWDALSLSSGSGRMRIRPSSQMCRFLLACLLLIAPAGCVGIKAHDARLRNAVDDGWERFEASRSLNVSPETGDRSRPPWAALPGSGRPRGRGPAARGSSPDPIRARWGDRPGRVVVSCRAWPARRESRSWRWPGTAMPPLSPRWP